MRRRRLRIRARQRGILEICVLFERFLEVSRMDNETEITDFEKLLLETDRDIEVWLGGISECPKKHRRILTSIQEKLNIPKS